MAPGTAGREHTASGTTREASRSKSVGVLGSSGVAQTLAEGCAAAGYSVQIGSRDTAKLAAFAASAGGSAGTFESVAASAPPLVLAVKGTAAEPVVTSLAETLAGKVVIDGHNPIAEGPPEGNIVRYFTGPNDSLLERLQAVAPEARFVKAWSCVSAHLMIHPQRTGLVAQRLGPRLQDAAPLRVRAGGDGPGAELKPPAARPAPPLRSRLRRAAPGWPRRRAG